MTPLTVWMYYETDGDSGYYAIKLFATEASAKAHAAHQQGKAYGRIKVMEVAR